MTNDRHTSITGRNPRRGQWQDAALADARGRGHGQQESDFSHVSTVSIASIAARALRARCERHETAVR